MIKLEIRQHDETEKKVTFINSVKELSLFHSFALTFSFFVIYIIFVDRDIPFETHKFRMVCQILVKSGLELLRNRV